MTMKAGTHYVTDSGRYECCGAIATDNPNLDAMFNHFSGCTGTGVRAFKPLAQHAEPCRDRACLVWAHDEWKGA